jgi:hypothetical protein
VFSEVQSVSSYFFDPTSKSRVSIEWGRDTVGGGKESDESEASEESSGMGDEVLSTNEVSEKEITNSFSQIHLSSQALHYLGGLVILLKSLISSASPIAVAIPLEAMVSLFS